MVFPDCFCYVDVCGDDVTVGAFGAVTVGAAFVEVVGAVGVDLAVLLRSVRVGNLDYCVGAMIDYVVVGNFYCLDSVPRSFLEGATGVGANSASLLTFGRGRLDPVRDHTIDENGPT